MRLGVRIRRLAPWCASLALTGLLFLASSAVDMSAITAGSSSPLVASALIVSLENASGGQPKRMLSSGPMTYLGRISYGIYLWHWPVIIVISHDRYVSPVRLFVLATLIATALAALSFRLLEHPLRTSRLLDRYRTPVIAIGFSTSLLVGLLVMPVVLDSGTSTVAASDTSPSSALRLLDWRVAQLDVPKLPDCLGAPVDKCTIVHGTRQRVLLVGDSHARMWIPAFEEIARRESLTLSVAVLPGCPWQRGVVFTGDVFLTPGQRRDCLRHQADWYDRVVPQLRPDVIILVHKGYDDPRFSLGLGFSNGQALGPRGRGLRTGPGRRVVGNAERAHPSWPQARRHRARSTEWIIQPPYLPLQRPTR